MHPVTLTQVVIGTVLVAAVLEASRRSVGFWFFVTTLLFMAYLVLAPWLPGFLRSPRAYSYPRLIEMFYLYADEGVLGSLTGISSNILMIFILFASFMLHSGVGQFFMDISIALAGRFRGGPAKVAVVSSGLYGTVSGSSVADCYATGTFTIPLMKRIGYRPEIAGRHRGVRLVRRAADAAHHGRRRLHHGGADRHPLRPDHHRRRAAGHPLLRRHHGHRALGGAQARDRHHARRPAVDGLAGRRSLLFAPFFTIVYFLHAGYSPSKAALYSLLTAVVVSWVAGDSPMTPRRIFETMGDAMRSGVIIASVLAASGLIVASMSRTGFALAFSSAIIGFSGGYVIVALFLVFVVISVLGTGIPTTPAYILAVAVGGTALTNLGVDLLAAHLFVFYYAVLADVTPPVAVTAVAGAQMAGANPMTTGWHATRIGIGGFLAPFLFAFQPPLLMKGEWSAIVLAFVSALVGISALSAAVAGHMFTPLSWPHRIFLIVVSLAAISPYISVSLVSSAVLVGYMVWDWRRGRQRDAIVPVLRVTERPTIARAATHRRPAYLGLTAQIDHATRSVPAPPGSSEPPRGVGGHIGAPHVYEVARVRRRSRW